LETMTGFPILSIVKNITLAQEVVNLGLVFAHKQERLFLTLPRVNVMVLNMFQDAKLSGQTGRKKS